MSDLNDMVRVYVGDADVVTVPLVDNLTASNAAPKASTVGAALAEKVDTDSVMEHVSITVDGIESDNQGVILINGDDIPIDDTQGADDIKTYVDAIGAKTAEDIVYESGETATIKTVVDALAEDIEDVADNLFASEIKMSSTDTTTVSAKISEIDGKTAADIPYGTGSNVGAALGSMAESISSLQNGQTGTVKVSSQTFTDAEQSQARANVGAAAKTETVLVNESQTLNSTQKAQARANIGAVGNSEAVLLAEQTLTNTQKTQVKTNLGIPTEVVSDSTVLSTGLPVNYSKIGNICSVTVNGQASSAIDQWGSLGMLPEGYRPKIAMLVPNVAGSNAYVIFQPTGAINTSVAIAADGYVQASATFVTP